MIGRTLGALRLRRRFGVYVWLCIAATGRSGVSFLMNCGAGRGHAAVRRFGWDIQRLAVEMDLSMCRTCPRAYRRAQAPIALVFGTIVGLLRLGVAPIFLLSVLGR
jgi:hypothetical protein